MNNGIRQQILQYMIKEIEKQNSLTIQFMVPEKHIFKGDCTYDDYLDELDLMTQDGLLSYNNGGHELTVYGHRSIRPITLELAQEIRREWLETFASKSRGTWISISRTSQLNDPRYKRVDLLNELILMADDGLLLRDGHNYQITAQGRQYYQRLISEK